MPEDINPDRNYNSPPPGQAPVAADQTEAHEQSYPLEEAMKAQAALRTAARMPPERFPLPQIIAMFSDEIEALRNQGRPDKEIAMIISGASTMRVTEAEIQKFYATPEQRQKEPLGAR
ncbi:hypothetical protein [Terriglobus aquaticus]|uniref:Uncharacterized protein n=1 Tax=Terriglobus aquaticus TaxID=940139 RepID=A0ABW9KPD0_9BACT|nr:hypothetical protein [Terriglobus aquaticus]